MSTFEKVVFFIPNNARYAPPFGHVYQDYVPRICHALECSIFYKDTISLGKLEDNLEERWDEEALLEAAALGSLNADEYFGIPVPSGLPDECVKQFSELQSLYNEVAVNDKGSEFGLSYNHESVASGVTKVETAFDTDTNLAFNRHNLRERAPSMIVAARKRAIKKLADFWRKEGVAWFDELLDKAPHTELRFRVREFDDSSITFEHWFPEEKFAHENDEYHTRSAIRYLVSEALKLKMCEELDGDPSDFDQSLSGLFPNSQTKTKLSEIIEFQDIVLPGMPTVAERLMLGDMTATDYAKLYEKSEKWRQWTSQIGSDQKLISEYVAEIANEPMISRMPSKTVRFASVAACGVGIEALAPSGLGALAALGIGAVDALFLDQCFSGWRPRSFVDSGLRAKSETKFTRLLGK
ncbi:MAG: hypothetical protein ACSHXB_15000 [Sulfitobacter sp.]